MNRDGRNARARVLLDGTPLLGNKTGIGRYTYHLLAELSTRPDIDLRTTAFSFRASHALRIETPPGVSSGTSPVPARILQPLWRRIRFPSVEMLAGTADVFHATNFVLPPVRHAASVVTVHDLAFISHPETMNPAGLDLRKLVPDALARADAVCTVSNVVRDRISTHFQLAPERIFVTPNGVDSSWSTAQPPGRALRARLNLPESYLLFVGTREPRKGLATLVAAYRRLHAELADTAPALLVVGAPGWGEDPTSEPVAGLVVADYVAQEDLPSVVAGAAVLVLPSVDEGFGMPAIEGLAAGVPVVVSDIPALLEVTGGAAITFPVNDPAGLDHALRRALEGDGPGRAQRIERASGFTVQRLADRTIEAYRYALERRGLHTALQRPMSR